MNKYLKISISILLSLIVIGILAYLEIIVSNLLKEHLTEFSLTILSLHIPILIYYLIKISLEKVFKIKTDSYGFSKKNIIKNLLIGSLIGFSILTISLGILLLSNNITINFSKTTFDSVFLIFVSSVIVGSWEELYFRGFINTLFTNYGISFNLTVIFSSVIFTVAHIISFNPAETSYFWLLGILFMGILFSILYEKFNSIFVPIGLHIIWDFISFGLVGRNDFKGFFIDNFQIFSKKLDDIETIIIFSFILLLFLREKHKQNCCKCHEMN